MSWPGPGTPSEHGGTDEEPSAPPVHREDDHAAPPAPATDGDPAADEGQDRDPDQDQDRDLGSVPASIDELRSETGDDLGRWQPERGRPPDPDVADAPAGDGQHEDALDRSTGEDAGHVSSDDPPGAGSARQVPDDPAPGGTDEDRVSVPLSALEGDDLGWPSISPQEPSWTPGSTPDEVDPGPLEAGHRSVAPEDAAAAVGPAPAADVAPPGDEGPGSPQEPVGGSARGPEDGEVAPFHGEHGTGAPAEDAGAFHGEHAPEPASAGHEEAGAPVPRSTSAAAIEDALSGLDVGDRSATVICVANQKGGVGKTTTTVSLGAALAMLGAQVLVVDLDPQGNATTGLGLRAQEGAPSTYRVIVEQMDVEDAAEPTAVRGLHVLPSSLDLAGAEIELVPAFSRENRLKQALDAVRDLYDVILIDCPPSLGLLTINALVAADQVLVPIQCEYYALEGLGQLMRTVKLVADSLNRGLGVGGVVLTMFDGRTNLSQQVVDEVQNYFGDIAYQTIVPRTVRLSEAPSYGQPIGVFDATSRGARAYQRLAREVAHRLDLELEDDDVSPLDRLLGASSPPPEEAAPLPTDLVPEDVPTAPEVDGDGAGDEGSTTEPPSGPAHPDDRTPPEDVPSATEEQHGDERSGRDGDDRPHEEQAGPAHEDQAAAEHGHEPQHHDGHDAHAPSEHAHGLQHQDGHEERSWHDHGHGPPPEHEQHGDHHRDDQHDEPASGTEGQP